MGIEGVEAGKLADGAGVPHGKLLVDFVNATAGDGDLESLRGQVADALGDDGLVDAAAVVANFTMMTRIADGTGTPLDAGSVDMSSDLRAQIGVDDFVSKRFVSAEE